MKLSDALVLDARLAGEVEKRSIAGQVEFWASLGKLIDALIDGRTRADALQRSGSKALSELVATIGTPEGDARLKAYLESEPFPHFEPHPTRKGVLIRIDADGTRSAGRFVDREFVVAPEHLSNDPWEGVEREYPIGSQVEGLVTKALAFWAFVQLREGIEGLMHVSEIMGGERTRHVSDVLRVGQQVKVNVLSVDAGKHEIKLSMKQVGARPEIAVDLKSKVRSKRQVALVARTR